MRAIVVRETGGLDALKLETLPRPEVGPSDVLIRVAASGVCAHDIAVRAGVLHKGVQLPLIPGHEVAGIVEAAGPAVRGFKPGDRVATTQRRYICGACRFCRGGWETLCGERVFLGDWGLNGGYAEFVSVDQRNVAPVPEHVPLAEAAIAACCVGTSLNAVRDVARVAPGERVLVTGAAGGLGLHALQLLRAAGAFVVATTSSPAKAAIIRENGAHEVVIAGRGADFSADVRRACGGEGVDVVLDNVGGACFHATRRSLAPLGKWLLIGQVDPAFVSFSPAQLIHGTVSLLPVSSCSRTQLEDTLALIARSVVRPIVAGTLPLEAAADAHARVEAARVSGRLVLTPNPELLQA
ncbi:quinone oxidoreductase family protein [Paraburkholderia unamae]|uniref:D-arabinose 1-dehydrogenase-like Zn-dependent alcohol dehydrogenase n=1 Tax=Paraburkholderia unamae TaxID=219649 RepID=A0ABX5K7J7_9BURK|nr:alcohol dehydrogenase catalytic domain-containing protein [Paraburkholderia unamae]PVX62703.1 D-arabinose 1-dehydrogenase-like Zn-dependent alcohol dehydrogenase [Paraburkholderia unamae]